MNIRTIAVAFAVSSLLLSSSAIAQQRHIVDAVAMNRAVAAQSATDQQNRDAVLGVLRQSRVRALASQMGLDVTKAEAAVSTLSGPELARVASQARTANTQLAGGSNTVIISTTTLLLILIIVILLVR
jgi:ATPase subunit of ABC transporter with duplicated ATPase domains